MSEEMEARDIVQMLNEFFTSMSAVMNYALAVAGGFFLYLGVHAVHGDWRRHGAGSAVLAAAGGIAAMAMQWGARMIWAF